MPCSGGSGTTRSPSSFGTGAGATISRSTLSLFNSHNAALTQIDEPKFRLSIRQNQLPNISGFYYMRLHGRNAAQWWKHDKSEDRYSYLYSANELTPFAETADAARRLVKKFYLYFNNHFASKAVVNAVMIKSQLGEPVPGAYPKAFVDAIQKSHPSSPRRPRRNSCSVESVDKSKPRQSP